MTHRAGVRLTGDARPDDQFDAVVIGAGFSGMYAVHRLLDLGLDVLGLESGDGPGGTWYWNRYPGARVDVESLVYSYSFDAVLEQDWRWPEDFSAQPELERYANHVADRFGLREQIRFGTTVTTLRYDDEARRWHVETDRGDAFVAQFVIAATGSLHAANTPCFPGAESFAGETYHTSRWPVEGVEFAGKRVGVIGTGSTGIQVIPVVAEQADHLTVFQRTANFAIPTRNRPMDPEFERAYKARYRENREEYRAAFALRGGDKRSVFEVDDDERERMLEEAWDNGRFEFLTTFRDTATSLEANAIVAEFIRNKIRAIVRDPEVAELLCPKSHPLGTKRPCLESGYYETYNRDNVTLVDVRADPIVEFTPTSIRTTSGEHELDMVVYATGFDAMTGSLTRMDVVGVGERTLEERWRSGAASYLGYMIADFPNLFMVHGPGSPSVLAPMIMGAEFQVDWIARLLEHMRGHGLTCAATTTADEASWSREVEEAADRTLYRLADSWYLGANIPGKPRVFTVYVGGINEYWRRCQEVEQNGYEGIALS